MYRAADRLDPDGYRRLAAAVYAEMALAGITSVGEFHYLHHDVGGVAYADPNAMGQALIAGAADAGVRLTLLDTCYLSSGVDGAPLAAGPQQRFGDGSGDAWAERVEALHRQVGALGGQQVIVGAALHSVRGVPLEHMPAVVEWAEGHGAPLHVHSSEQTAEIDQCLAVHGATPTALLRDAGVLGPRTTAVHATHLTDEDLSDLDSHGHRGVFLSHHRARPRRRHRSGGGAAGGWRIVQSRVGLTRGDRPVRGGAGNGTRRTPGPSRTRA